MFPIIKIVFARWRLHVDLKKEAMRAKVVEVACICYLNGEPPAVAAERIENSWPKVPFRAPEMAVPNPLLLQTNVA